MSSVAVKRRARRPGHAREVARRALLWAAFWLGIGLLALVAAFVLPAKPLLAAVPAAVAVSALLCARFPVAAFAVLFVLSGGFWTIEVFTPIRTGPGADLVLAGLWIGSLRAFASVEEPGVRRVWPGALLAMGFVLASFLSIFLANDLYPALYTFRLSYWYLLAALLIAYVPLPQDALWKLTRVAVVVAGLVGAYAVLRWVIGPSAAESTYVKQATASGYESINGQVRLFGSMGAGHILSSWVAPMSVFCFALVIGLRGRWRLAALVAAGLSAAALVGTEVRAGEAAAGIGLVFVLVVAVAASSLGARRIAAIGAAGLVAAAGVGTIVVSQSGRGTETSKRFEAILSPERDDSFQQRLFKWRTALAEIDRKPLGEGLGTSGQAAKKFGRYQSISTLEIDSSYLKIALEQGLFAMVAFAAVLAWLLVGLTARAIGPGDPLGSTLAVAGAGALLAFAVQMGFGTYIEGIASLGVWLAIGLGMRAASRIEPATA